MTSLPTQLTDTKQKAKPPKCRKAIWLSGLVLVILCAVISESTSRQGRPHWRLQVTSQEKYNGRDFVRLRLTSDLKGPFSIFRVHSGWFTPVGPQEVEDHPSFTFTGKWDIVVFVPTNTPARYQMRVLWARKRSVSDKLKATFEELRKLNRTSLADVRDVWSQSWSWYGEETVETGLITNSLSSAR